MLYPFSALLARMKYITRWSLMHSTRAESLSEHTCDTALLAHTLCLIARRYTGTPCRPKTVAVAALYHDAPEIITGDLPTPVKYHSAMAQLGIALTARMVPGLFVLCGARTPQQAADNAGAMHIHLDGADAVRMKWDVDSIS